MKKKNSEHSWLVQVVQKFAAHAHAGAVLVSTSLCLIVSVPANAQGIRSLNTGNALEVTRTAAQPPLSHLYWHFLMHQNHLDQAAAARVSQGKDGTWLRNHYQKKLGFTDAEFANVRTTGVRLAAEVKAIDDQAKTIVMADRSLHPPEKNAPRQWRQMPPELKTLSQKREAVIARETAALQQKLGSGNAAKLDSFLKTTVAPNVTATQLHPHPRDANGLPLRLPRQEVRK